MTHSEVMLDLPIIIGGVPCIIPVLWAIEQTSHDMIIGNNFQRLYSPCTQKLDKMIFNINGETAWVKKMKQAYTHQNIEFTRSKRGEEYIV